MDIGIVGAGRIGGTLARGLAPLGHHVVIANSRGPETLASLIAEIGPNAEAGTVEQAARAGDVVIIAVPFKATFELPAAPFAGHIVVDAGNYYPEPGGHFAELDNDTTTSSELTARHFPEARIVKAFNTIWWRRLRSEGKPAGAPDRLAIPVAGDDAAAKAVVSMLIDELGFDAVDTGSLAGGGRLQQPGSEIYDEPLTAAQVKATLSRRE